MEGSHHWSERTQPSPGPHVQALQGASVQLPESLGQPDSPPHWLQVASCSGGAGGLRNNDSGAHVSIIH